MENNFKTKELNEICDFYNGLWTGKKPPYVEVGVIRNTNFMNDGRLDDSDIAHLKVEKKQFEKKQLRYGDIILEKSGGGPKQPVGRVIIFDKKSKGFSFSNFTSAIRIKDPNEIDFTYLHRFLFWTYMTGLTERMQSHSTGIRNLDLNAYKKIKISYPSFTEQKQIVNYLDQTSQKILKAHKNIDINLEYSSELFESFLQEIFNNPRPSWEKKRLGEVCQFFNGKAHEKDINEDGNYIVVNSRFISSGGRIYKRTKKQFFPLFTGDVVMVMSDVPRGKALAKCYLIEKDNVYSLNQRICAIRSELFEKKFLYYQLNRNKYFLNFDNGENQTNLRKDDILNCPLFVPPLTEQRLIIGKLDSLLGYTKKLESNYKIKLKNLDELAKSFFNMAFTNSL